MPLKIQIAFQGGGAKLCDLLAAAEVIQELESEGKIEVTRVAGTSAGSIVAGLIGLKEPIRVSIEKLKGAGSGTLGEMGGLKLGLCAYLRIVLGRPIMSERPLRKLLAILFKGYSKISDLRLPVFILAADILTAGKHVFTPDDPLVSSIADSCGLPFVFRSSSYMAMSRFVDGGICENLPSDDLLSGVAENGPVVAVSFATGVEADHPENFVDFMKLLVNTSINNSILRARKNLGETAVHCIDTTIDTFDFRQALDALEGGDHYQKVKLQCEKWFNTFLLVSQGTDKQQLMVSGPWERPQAIVTDIMGKVAILYNTQSQKTKLNIVQSALIVTAYSLLENGAPQHGAPDLLRLEYEVEPLQEPLPSFSLAVGSDEQVAGPTSWTVTDSNHNSCPFVAIPMDSKAAIPELAGTLGPFHFKHENEVALFFTPPLVPGIGNYRIVQQDIRFEAMKPLNETGKDYLTLVNQKTHLFMSAMLILYVPLAFRRVEVAQYTEDPTLKLVNGRAMNQAELNAFGPPPLGFRAVGWIGVKSVQPEFSLAASFVAP